MHNRTLLLLFLLSFCRLSAQVDERPYTLRSAELSGPVQTVFDSSYTVRRDTTGSVVGKSRLQRYRYDYGKDGNLQQTQLFSLLGEIVYENKLHYANGLVQRADYYHSGRLDSYRLFLYDKYNRLVKVTETDTSGEETVLRSWRYDRSGRVAESFEDYGVGSATFKHFYDTCGRLIRMEYGSGKRLLERITFVYSGALKVMETSEQFDEGTVTFKTVLVYDNGLPVRSDDYFQGTPSGSWVYDYTFDDHGNWITRVITIDGEETRFVKRRIDYY